jgi:hypothetical protein
VPRVPTLRVFKRIEAAIEAVWDAFRRAATLAHGFAPGYLKAARVVVENRVPSSRTDRCSYSLGCILSSRRGRA